MSAAVAASLVLVGCDGASPVAAPVALDVASPNMVAATSFLFTKIPAPVVTRPVTSPLTGVDLLTFQMNASQATGILVKEFGFMISGSLQAGAVTNYQLFYHPKGLGKPGVLVGTNDGSHWVPPGGSPSSFIRFPLAKPFRIPRSPFVAQFVLRADVLGAGRYFFSARAQTMTVRVGGVDQDVGSVGGDLPLQGDTFKVN